MISRLPGAGEAAPDEAEDPALADTVGWTFSTEDMAAFGIGNVTYEGDGEYPSDLAQQTYGVVLFSVSD